MVRVKASKKREKRTKRVKRDKRKRGGTRHKSKRITTRGMSSKRIHRRRHSRTRMNSKKRGGKSKARLLREKEKKILEVFQREVEKEGQVGIKKLKAANEWCIQNHKSSRQAPDTRAQQIAAKADSLGPVKPRFMILGTPPRRRRWGSGDLHYELRIWEVVEGEPEPEPKPPPKLLEYSRWVTYSDMQKFEEFLKDNHPSVPLPTLPSVTRRRHRQNLGTFFQQLTHLLVSFGPNMIDFLKTHSISPEDTDWTKGKLNLNPYS